MTETGVRRTQIRVRSGTDPEILRMRNEDHDLLIKINSLLQHLNDEFRRVSNGHGFPRCAERLSRIEVVEESVKLAHERISEDRKKAEEHATWRNRLLAAEGIGVVTAIVIAVMSYFLKMGGTG